MKEKDIALANPFVRTHTKLGSHSNGRGRIIHMVAMATCYTNLEQGDITMLIYLNDFLNFYFILSKFTVKKCIV